MLIASIRELIAENVQLAFPSMQVSPYVLANPTTPCAFLFPGPVQYDQAMHRGMDTWEFTLRAMIGATGDLAAQQLLDQLLEPTGSTSMKAAIEKDHLLGGLVFDLTVSDCTGYRQYQPTQAAAPVIGADWTLAILADGGGGP